MSDEEIFSECERKVLIICGMLKITKNKNVQRATILKRIPKNYYKEGNEAIDNLLKQGYLAYYRKPDNLQVTPKGRKIIFKLARENRKKVYPDLNILLLL